MSGYSSIQMGMENTVFFGSEIIKDFDCWYVFGCIVWYHLSGKYATKGFVDLGDVMDYGSLAKKF